MEAVLWFIKRVYFILTHPVFYYSKNYRCNVFIGNFFVDITDHFANFLIIGAKKKQKQGQFVRIFSDKNKDKFVNLLTTTWMTSSSRDIYFHTPSRNQTKL